MPANIVSRMYHFNGLFPHKINFGRNVRRWLQLIIMPVPIPPAFRCSPLDVRISLACHEHLASALCRGHERCVTLDLPWLHIRCSPSQQTILGLALNPQTTSCQQKHNILIHFQQQ